MLLILPHIAARGAVWQGEVSPLDLLTAGAWAVLGSDGAPRTTPADGTVAGERGGFHQDVGIIGHFLVVDDRDLRSVDSNADHGIADDTDGCR